MPRTSASRSIAGGVILIPGAPLLSIALNANVLATVLLPVSLVFMVMLANDRELMGSWATRAADQCRAIVVVIGSSASAAPPTASTRSCVVTHVIRALTARPTGEHERHEAQAAETKARVAPEEMVGTSSATSSKK